MGWLKIFDASGSWPTDPAACWADGYRVIAGYAGSQSWKTFTPAMLAKWVTPEHPFGIAAMYESTGLEPLQVGSAAAGTAHARAARAAWRALGMPDSAAIAYAVDTNVSMTQVKGPVADYFRAVAAADTARPIAYLENDGADWLAGQGIIAGGFIPAAYSWNNPAVLVTPANASAFTLWTQEHNGFALHGGNVDIGHIRDDAPIWWAGDTTMALTSTDLDAIAHRLLTGRDLPATNPVESFGSAVLGAQNHATSADAKLDTLLAKLDALPAAIAAAVVAALPPSVGVTAGTDVQFTGTAHLGAPAA